MYNTLKIFSNSREKRLEDLTNEELAAIYNEENKSAIVAEIFYKNFGALNTLARKFPTLNNEDKVSLILEKVDETLKTYNKELKIKFITYLMTIIRNALSNSLRDMNYQKRKYLQKMLSLDYSYQKKGENKVLLKDLIEDKDNTYEVIELELLLETLPLTDIEKMICKIYINDNSQQTTDKEIMNKFNISRVKYKRLKEKLKEKLRKIFEE